MMGGNREHQSQGMLESAAPYTDQFLLLHTGPTAETAVNLALARWPNSMVRHWDPGDAGVDCAVGRNICLYDAQRAGADWVLNLDTDEVLHVPPTVNLRHVLETTDADVILIRDYGGNYRKTKFFRAPIKGTYQVEPTAGVDVGVHEYFQPLPGAVCKVLPGVFFWEHPKPREVEDRRMAEIERVSRLQVQANPAGSRSWYYLGEALAYRCAFDEALFAFFACFDVSDWQDEKWWCYYKAAWARMGQGRMASAIEYCRLGAIGQPTWPEFPWLAAVCAAKCEAWEQAVEFALEADALAEDQREHECGRTFFANRTAWWEGPSNTLRVCYAHLGEVELAKRYHDKFGQMVEERSRA
jgi:hypothetical protein